MIHIDEPANCYSYYSLHSISPQSTNRTNHSLQPSLAFKDARSLQQSELLLAQPRPACSHERPEEEEHSRFPKVCAPSPAPPFRLLGKTFRPKSVKGSRIPGDVCG